MIGPDPAIRPFATTDADRLNRMFDRLSAETVRRRFFAAHPKLRNQMIRELVSVDHERHEAIVALVGTEIIGVASYHRDDDEPTAAEVAVLIEDDWQHHGVGRRLSRNLAALARERGLSSFNAAVLAENQGAVGLIRRSNLTARTRWDHGVLIYALPLRPAGAALAQVRSVAADARDPAADPGDSDVRSDAMSQIKTPFTGDEEADRLLTDNPLALLTGMLLDQQVPMEWAFRGPLELSRRLGTLDAASLAHAPVERVVEAFVDKPALHRYPRAMAERVHALCEFIDERYAGDAAAIWTTAPSAEDLFARLRELPGYGEQKARIFVAILGKRLGVAPEGWEALAGAYGQPGYRSIADVDGPGAVERVRAFKRDAKAAARAQATSTPSSRARVTARAPRRSP